MLLKEAEEDHSCRRPGRKLLAIVEQGFAKLRLQNPAEAAVNVAGHHFEPQVAVQRRKATAKTPA